MNINNDLDDDINFDGYYDEDEEDFEPLPQNGPAPSLFYNPNIKEEPEADFEEEYKEEYQEKPKQDILTKLLNKGKDPEDINDRIIKMSELSTKQKIFTIVGVILFFLIILIILIVIK